MTQNERLDYLIRRLLRENSEYADVAVPERENDRKRLLRALMNVRPPKAADDEFLAVQNEYLQKEIADKGITDIADLKPVKGDLYLWRGDITTLRCDGIVNAANSRLLGCFYPNHGCIDNAIHTFAGIQLRLKCAEIMKEQRHEEPTGNAKITPAYNLPCKYVLHTVGPVVCGQPTEKNKADLARCYLSCLRLANDNGLNSIAFCCISTGEFSFPAAAAAQTAVNTVNEYKTVTRSGIKVIFNVYKESDYEIYRRLLGNG